MTRRILACALVVLSLIASPALAQQPIVGTKTPADNFGNPADALTVWALLGCWDATGTNWDRCQSISVGLGAADAHTPRHVEADDSPDVVALQSMTTGMSLTNAGVRSAATNNAKNVKATQGRLMGIWLLNTTATTYWFRLYNTAGTPDCSSATGAVGISLPVPPNVGGWSFNFGPTGFAFGAGIGYCITGGSADNDNTPAATGISGLIGYKP